MSSDKPTPDSLPREPLERLLAVMAWLRHPVHGCPWDLKQDFANIAPYTLEEAYEVADAIRRGDRSDLREELGDLLLQVVYHARMAEEEGAFAFKDVAQAIADKMVNRHPHVFGDAHVEGDEHQSGVWEQIKAQERGARQAAASVLDGVALALPSLVRAEKLQKRAARVGFDWGAAGPVIDKIEEEIGELREALAGGDTAAIKDEFGDMLFALVNLGRHLKLDAEAALAGTNDKFRTRFHHVERALAEQGRSLEEASLEEMEALWQQAKTAR